MKRLTRINQGPSGLHTQKGYAGMVEIYSPTTLWTGSWDVIAESLLHDSRNRLWFSSDEIQGVACIVGKEIYHYGRPEGFHLSHPYVMTEDKEGTIWFTEWGEGLCAFDGKTFATYTRKQGLFSDTIHAIAVDSAGAIWCATRLGISRFESDRSRFTNYVSEGEFGVDFRYITAGQHNDVWMAGNERGLFHFRSDQEAQIKGTANLECIRNPFWWTITNFYGLGA